MEVGIPQAPAALLTRQVDIATTVEPFSTVLIESGEAVPLYSEFIEITPGGLISVWCTTRSWFKAHSQEGAELVSVIGRGIAYNQAHQDEARLRLTKFTRIDPSLVNKVTWPVWKLVVERGDLRVPMELAVKYGLLKKPLLLDQIVLPTANPK
jgi:NitT/TauT family transport system substrate-binding protein